MALNAAVVFECQTGGSDTNGGGFKTGATGTDRSQQTAAQAVLTTASVVNATTTIIDVAAGDYTVSATDVGNIVNVSVNGGANALYEITVADTGNNRWTVDRSLGTAGWTVAGNMGGCFATPGMVGASITVDGQLGWIKSGTYTLSTATTGAGGPMALVQNGRIEGYQTTRGDKGTKPILSAGAYAPTTLMSSTGSKEAAITNMKADSNSQVTNGFSASSSGRNRIVCCDAINSASGAYGFTGAGTFISCYAKDCDIGHNPGGVVINCAANDCVTGFRMGAGAHCINCLSYGTGTTAFNAASTGAYAFRCTANGATTAFSGSTSNATYTECLAVSCTTGFVTSGTRVADINRCYVYNCGTNTSGTFLSATVTVLTADPFVAVGSEDFRPNNTTGGGRSLRAAALGVPNQTCNNDIGAVQHSDATQAAIADVRNGTTYDDATKTGTAYIPAAANVRFGTNVDATTGTCKVPVAANVRDGIATDVSDTGTINLPIEYNVRNGVTYDAAAKTGNMTLPAIADVKNTVQYGGSGTEFTGTYTPTADYPVEADVRNGTVFDTGAKTGTAYIPTAANTRFGVNVDATTGTCKVPVAANVRSGIATDVSDTGTLDLPAIANVRSGTVFDATTKTGTCAVPAAGNVLTPVAVDATTGTLTLPGASDVWHTAATYGNPGSPVTPTKVGSSIPNLVAGNVKNAVVIDDVTGTFAGGGGGGIPGDIFNNIF